MKNFIVISALISFLGACTSNNQMGTTNNQQSFSFKVSDDELTPVITDNNGNAQTPVPPEVPINEIINCEFNGRSVLNGESVEAFINSSVNFGENCVSETRQCTNGNLSGTNHYSECSVEAAASCLFNGDEVNHGTSVRAYLESTVGFGEFYPITGMGKLLVCFQVMIFFIVVVMFLNFFSNKVESKGYFDHTNKTE